MCLKQVSLLCHFCLFFKLCSRCFKTTQWLFRYTGSSGFARVFD